MGEWGDTPRGEPGEPGERAGGVASPSGLLTPEVTVAFHGVRGSTPCSGPQYARYGGNTSCVSVHAAEHEPVVFDLGTGLRRFGEELGCRPWEGSVLLTHLHWDHVQGLPFFTPLLHEGTVLHVYGPPTAEGSFGELFADLMRPPYFPITPGELPGSIAFHDAATDDFAVNGAKVRSRWVRHTGATLGFRVELEDVSIAYVSDHGQGVDGTDDLRIPHDVLDLCDGVDLLIHDAQHTCEEFEHKRHWGHCSVDYAVHVARESGAHRLALFHHCPTHDDDAVDRQLARARELAAGSGLTDVLAAHEGLRVTMTRERA